MPTIWVENSRAVSYTHLDVYKRQVQGVLDALIFRQGLTEGRGTSIQQLPAGKGLHHGEYANGSATERMALYRRCEAEGVGISVMKAFAGGQLLDAHRVA